MRELLELVYEDLRRPLASETAENVSDSIINPVTNRTFRHEKLLSTAMDWTSEKRIIDVLMRHGAATPAGLIAFARALKITADGRGQTGASEAQIGNALLSMIRVRDVRRVIAEYVSQAHQIPRKQAMRDLLKLKMELEGEQRMGVQVTDSGLVLSC